MDVTVNPIKCHNDNTGAITIIVDQTFNEAFTIEVLDSTKKVLGQFYNQKPQPWEINGLRSGKYIVTLQTKSNNPIEQKIIELKNPEELKVNKITIESVSDGENPLYSIKANPTGGTPPFNFIWSENTGNQTSQIAKNLSEGTYTCKINDSNECSSKTVTFFLYDPEIQKYKEQKRNK